MPVEHALTVPRDEPTWSGASALATGGESPGSSTAGSPPGDPDPGGGGPGPKPCPYPCVPGTVEITSTAGGTVGIGRRIAELYEVKVNALLDRAEDPRQVLDYSYARQQELVLRIRRAITDVAAARSRAAVQESQLRSSAARLQHQARQAVAADREELARQALALRTATLAQADDLVAEQAALRADEERLSAAARRLQPKVEAFRVHKETLKARYTAAQAAERRPGLGGISEEMGDVDLATRRAEDTAARLQARANALEDLLASGSPADVTGLASEGEIRCSSTPSPPRPRSRRNWPQIKDQLAAEARQPPDGPRAAAAEDAIITHLAFPAGSRSPCRWPDRRTVPNASWLRSVLAASGDALCVKRAVARPQGPVPPVAGSAAMAMASPPVGENGENPRIASGAPPPSVRDHRLQIAVSNLEQMRARARLRNRRPPPGCCGHSDPPARGAAAWLMMNVDSRRPEFCNTARTTMGRRGIHCR